MLKTNSSFIVPSALLGVAALAMTVAATPARAIQNNGNSDMGSACTFVNNNRYYCVFDNGLSYYCRTNYPKGPEECTPALRANPSRTIKTNPGLMKRTN